MPRDLRIIRALVLSLCALPLTWSQPAAFLPPARERLLFRSKSPRTFHRKLWRPKSRQCAASSIRPTAHIDYKYGSVGPSGVSKVEIYVTADRGLTWVKFGEDQDRESPALVQLPGDGVYGIRLAITNGDSFGGTPPRPGERPQFNVEVDTTAPEAALQPYDLVPHLSAIDIRWTANDTNLTPEPVSLFYRNGPVLDWHPIARDIKNDGVYRWVMPRDLVTPIFIKVDVTDLAGNTTTVETPSPIVLDHSEVEATPVDVQPRDPSQTNTVVPATTAPMPRRLPVRLSAPIQLPTPASLPALPSVPVRSSES